MKNIIIGSGVVGQATGEFLEANGEEVIYLDTNDEILKKLNSKGKKTADYLPDSYDLTWICTHENKVLGLIPPPSRPQNDLLDHYCESTITVIRSTIPPELCSKISHSNVVHMPEFLREAVPLEGTFFPDRLIIGTNSFESKATTFFTQFITQMFECPYAVVPMEVSSLIKIVSNAWLATQITFWNEIYHSLPHNLSEYRQTIPNLVTLDKRISKYGTIMTGKKFGGNCLPKDLDHLIKFTDSKLLKAVKGLNEK